MINVNFVKKEEHYISVAVSGHAYANKPGHDLVCAAVSAIMVGALNAFAEMVKGEKTLVMNDKPQVLIQVSEADQKSDQLFEFLHYQLKTLEESEGQYLRINEKEDNS